MTYGHLQADCLYTGISYGPNARCRVWEAFTFLLSTHLCLQHVDHDAECCFRARVHKTGDGV